MVISTYVVILNHPIYPQVFYFEKKIDAINKYEDLKKGPYMSSEEFYLTWGALEGISEKVTNVVSDC